MLNRVPDALTLENHRISLKSCVYEREAERERIQSLERYQVCPSKLA
ncbi:hypothetical protein [uncultured Helicobacter sp.]